MVVYKNKLFQAVSGATTNGVFTRYYSSEGGWSDWTSNGFTGEDVSMIVFYDRLYQAVRGKTSTDHIFTRYTTDGIEWTDWVKDDQMSTQTPMTRISSNNGGYVASADEMVSVVFPGQTVTQDIVVTITKLQNAWTLVSGSFQLIGDIYDFTAYNASGNLVTEFLGDVEITFYYNPNELGGISEASLKIYYYHERSAQWIEIPSTVNTTDHSVRGFTDHFTAFAVFAPIAAAEPTPIPIPNEPTPPVNPSAVPEPGTLMLIALGVLGLRMLVRKRMKHKK
jgi:hypothetical protein